MGEPPPSLPDCRSCGACCSVANVLGDRFYPLMDDRAEVARLPTEIRAQVVEGKLSPKSPSLWGFPLIDSSTPGITQCSQFVGAIGACECGIYNNRPRLCRDFEPGSSICLEWRKEFGLDGGETDG